MAEEEEVKMARCSLIVDGEEAWEYECASCGWQRWTSMETSVCSDVRVYACVERGTGATGVGLNFSGSNATMALLLVGHCGTSCFCLGVTDRTASRDEEVTPALYRHRPRARFLA